jgi:hypothetical protein
VWIPDSRWKLQAVCASNRQAYAGKPNQRGYDLHGDLRRNPTHVATRSVSYPNANAQSNAVFQCVTCVAYHCGWRCWKSHGEREAAIGVVQQPNRAELQRHAKYGELRFLSGEHHSWFQHGYLNAHDLREARGRRASASA